VLAFAADTLKVVLLKVKPVPALYVVLESDLHPGTPSALVFQTLFAWPEPDAT
jgi:hypothetical protein